MHQSRLVKESSLEARCCKWALETHGVKNLKVYSRGNPDRLFYKKGRHFFVEFKRLGEKPSSLQAYLHGMLRADGEAVYVIDNFERFKYVLEEWL